MTTLIVIRHGESEANRNEIFAGHLDADLQAKGLEQAKKTAEYISENFKVHRVYSSDLKRAYKTGKCVADLCGVDILADKNLREINAGKWDGLKFDKLKALYEKEYSMWLNDTCNSRCVGGESVKELAKRIMSAMTKIAEANPEKTVVVSTHGTPIRAMQTLMQFGNLDEMKKVDWVSNASVSVFEYHNGSWKLVMAGYDEHLGEFITNLPKNV